MRLPGTETDSWVEHEGCETPKYAVLRTGKRSERTLQRKLVFRENTVDSEIRAVLAEYREEFPISVGLCHEDRARFRAGARNADDSNEACGIRVFYSDLSNPASATPVSPTLSVCVWIFERWSARPRVSRGVRTAHGQPETQGTQRLRRPTLYRAPELVETHQEVQA
jgi:hypothetical protein